MKKFLVTYHAPIESMAQMASATPEQQAEGMKTWMDWFAKCGEHIVDTGAPLMNGQALSSHGSYSASDKQVCGYSVLQASDMDHAKSLVEGHPHTSGWNQQATLEIHETMPLPGM